MRAERAKLDPTMQMEAWDDTAEVRYDRALLNKLLSPLPRRSPVRHYRRPGRRGEDLPGSRPHDTAARTERRKALPSFAIMAGSLGKWRLSHEIVDRLPKA